MKLISIFADAIKSQLLLKLVTLSIVVCCQRLCTIKVSYRKLLYHIWKLSSIGSIGQALWSRGATGSQVSLY